MRSQLEIKVRKELVNAIRSALSYAKDLQYYKKHSNKAEAERSYSAMREFDQVVYTLCNILDKERTYWLYKAKRMRIGDFM